MTVNYIDLIKDPKDLPIGITLFTSHSPNAHKITIYLELLHQSYNLRKIDRVGLEQKQDWYLELNPQGKVPLLIDNLGDGQTIVISESNAILLYIANKFDVEYKYYKPENVSTQLYYDELKYLFLQEGGLRPVQFQWKWYLGEREEDVLSIDRFKKETLIVHDVLERQLKANNTGYLISTGLNIVDIAFYPFLIRSKDLLKVDLESDYPLTNQLFKELSSIKEVRNGLSAI